MPLTCNRSGLCTVQLHHRLVGSSDLHKPSPYPGRHEDTSSRSSSLRPCRSTSCLVIHQAKAVSPAYPMVSRNTASWVVKQINSFPSIIYLFTLYTALAIAMKLCEGIDVSEASKSTKILSVSVHPPKVNSALRTLLCGRC